MNDRLRSSLLWGLVGVFTFLVAAQGYQLLVAPLPLAPVHWVGVAAFVGLAVTLSTYAVEARLVAKGRT